MSGKAEKSAAEEAPKRTSRSRRGDPDAAAELAGGAGGEAGALADEANIPIEELMRRYESGEVENDDESVSVSDSEGDDDDSSSDSSSSDDDGSSSSGSGSSSESSSDSDSDDDKKKKSKKRAAGGEAAKGSKAPAEKKHKAD